MKIFFDWCTNYKDTVIRPEHITQNRIAGNHSYIINPASEREIGTEHLFGRIEKLFNETEYIYPPYDVVIMKYDCPQK